MAEQAGLTLIQVSGDPRRWYIPESNGTGAAWLDYDGDHQLDLLTIGDCYGTSASFCAKLCSRIFVEASTVNHMSSRNRSIPPTPEG